MGIIREIEGFTQPQILTLEMTPHLQEKMGITLAS